MGARQSRRSVDITTTPKKEGLPAEGVVGDAAAPGDGKLEKIEETDAKPTTNGVAPHTDAATPEDQEKDKDEATEKEKEKEDAPKVEEPKVESPTTETPAEGAAAEVTTPTEGTPASPTTATSPESKETKKKDKPKKKWSFRSISFGKKDKNKPVREDAPKNGDVAKETLVEGGEEAEAASSPADDKSAVSSPTEKEESGEAVAETTVATEAKPEDDKSTASSPAAVVAAPVAAAAVTVAAPATPAPAPAPVTDEKKEEPSTPAPTPVPVEAAKKLEEMDKQLSDPMIADNIVEVSPVQAIIEAPIEVNSQSKQKATTTTTTTSTTTTTTTATTAPSIIERKTSEDLPSQFPSSPPPTPIDPSPLQQAQQVAANASAIAEALKLPAEQAANKVDIINASSQPKNPETIKIIPSTTTSAISSSLPADIISSSDNHAPIPITTITKKPIIEQTSEITTSESQEQTGNNNALTIPANTNIITDINNEKTEKMNIIKIPINETTIDNIVETIDSIKSNENDLVIQTEEGPIPVSDNIVIDNKLAKIVLETTVEEINNLEIIMKAEKNLEDSLSPNNVESIEGLVVSIDKEIPKIFNETIVENVNVGNIEKEVPPPLPASPVPVPKATSQLLNFMSTQIEDSSIVDDIIDYIPLPSSLMELVDNQEILDSIDHTQSQNLVELDNEEILESIYEPQSQYLVELDNEEILESMYEPQSQNLVELDNEEILESICEPQSQNLVVLDNEEFLEMTYEPQSQNLVELDNNEILDIIDETQSQNDTSCSLPPPEEISESLVEDIIDTIEELPPAPQECLVIDIDCNNTSDTKNTINSEISEVTVSPTASSIPQIPIDTTLLTPPRSPSPNNADTNIINEQETLISSLQFELTEDNSNNAFKTESIEDSLNSYNDSDIELKERLAETLLEDKDATTTTTTTTTVNGLLSYDIEDNDQSKIDTPVENNVVANENGTTETNDDAPLSPPPAVPAEILPTNLGPALTEDVASVTKAIEEIDINEKAVAAAVNENIESVNTNEIIADMNHHNNMKE